MAIWKSAPFVYAIERLFVDTCRLIQCVGVEYREWLVPRLNGMSNWPQ